MSFVVKETLSKAIAKSINFAKKISIKAVKILIAPLFIL